MCYFSIKEIIMKTKYYLISILITLFSFSAISQYAGNDSDLAMSDETSAVKNVPCKINYLKVSNDNNNNVLNWQAIGEDVNSDFYIERSTDGVNFETIGNVESNNDKNIDKKVQPQEYSFTDNANLHGTIYYTIKYESTVGTLYSKAIKIER